MRQREIHMWFLNALVFRPGPGIERLLISAGVAYKKIKDHEETKVQFRKSKLKVAFLCVLVGDDTHLINIIGMAETSDLAIDQGSVRSLSFKNLVQAESSAATKEKRCTKGNICRLLQVVPNL